MWVSASDRGRLGWCPSLVGVEATPAACRCAAGRSGTARSPGGDRVLDAIMCGMPYPPGSRARTVSRRAGRPGDGALAFGPRIPRPGAEDRHPDSACNRLLDSVGTVRHLNLGYASDARL